MFNLQGSEIIVILLLALVVLGPEKLPDAIRKFSQTYGELKKMGTGFQSELKSALDEPMREIRETADLVQRSADPKRIAEEAENEARLRAEADAAALTGAADLPIDPAALAVSDPVAAAEVDGAAAADGDAEVDGAAAEADGADAEAEADRVGTDAQAGAAEPTSEPVNGTKVNQIALSMARGPIDPEPAPIAAAHADAATEADDVTAPLTVPLTRPLTAPPEGAASMLAPPPSGAAVADAPPTPPPTPPPTLPTLPTPSSGVAGDDVEESAP